VFTAFTLHTDLDTQRTLVHLTFHIWKWQRLSSKVKPFWLELYVSLCVFTRSETGLRNLWSMRSGDRCPLSRAVHDEETAAFLSQGKVHVNDHYQKLQ